MDIIINENQFSLLTSKINLILLNEDENQDVYNSLKTDKSPENIANIIRNSKGYFNDKEAWAEAAFNTIPNMTVYDSVSKSLGKDVITFIKSFMNIRKKYHVKPILTHYNHIKNLKPITQSTSKPSKPNIPSKDINGLNYSENLINFLKNEEGLRLEAYKPKGDVWTIGWGHTGIDAAFEGNKIDKSKALQLLREDLNVASNCVKRYFKEFGINVKITQSMFDTLCSLAFNSGCGNLRKSGKNENDVLSFIKKGEYRKAADKILTFRANKSGFSGLKKRREKEFDMFCREGGCA